jgi:hypothetical protein
LSLFFLGDGADKTKARFTSEAGLTFVSLSAETDRCRNYLALLSDRLDHELTIRFADFALRLVRGQLPAPAYRELRLLYRYRLP